jgi:hypothetical protein
MISGAVFFPRTGDMISLRRLLLTVSIRAVADNFGDGSGRVKPGKRS